METEILVAASKMPSHLKRYWLGPKGSARVGGWGNEGSFRACQREMRKEGVPSREIDGLCANLYEAATGQHPGRKKDEMSTDLDVLFASLTVEPEEIPAVEGEPERYAAWEGILTVEGVESGDGRMFSYGSLDWDNPPIPLMYQPANIGGHSGSVLVGQIQQVYRKGNQVYGAGIIDLNARYGGEDIGREVLRLMDEKLMNGVSVDVDKVKDADVKLIFADGPLMPGAKPKMTVFNRGRVRGATLVAFPAFTEAKIYLTGDVLTASAVGEVLVGEEVLTAASHTIEIPDLPPAQWFDRPTDVEMRGALTVTDEGRVFGRLAPAGVTHRSVKTKVPMKNVDYTRFMGKETLVAGGGRVVTGPITMNCGHASPDPQVYGTLDKRMEHYDNACSVIANVRIGEDDDGVWVAGALAPFATAQDVSRLMSCTLSGDWQPHPDRQGVREFIAALAVPVPGFAMARQAASVTMEEGVVVASSVPVEFTETSLLTAANRKKGIYQSRVVEALNSRKLELARKLGRADV
jgi:hypothetical protein